MQASSATRPSASSKPFFVQLLLILAPIFALLVGLRWFASLGYDVDAFVSLGIWCAVIGSLCCFIWSLCHRGNPWRSFRLWLCVQMGFFVGIAALILMGPATPTPPGVMKCGTGLGMLLMMLPFFAAIYGLSSWFLFGVAKKTIEIVSPNYYKPMYLWAGVDTNECGEGGLALAEGEEISEGALSIGGIEGQLSFAANEEF